MCRDKRNFNLNYFREQKQLGAKRFSLVHQNAILRKKKKRIPPLFSSQSAIIVATPLSQKFH